MTISGAWIKGLMFGIQYAEDEDAFYILIDLGVISFLITKEFEQK